MTYEGQYTTEEEFTTLREAIDATHSAPGMPLLIDLSRSSQADSQRESRSLALVLGGLRRKIGRRCAVVVSDQVQYGIARMLSAYVEPYDLTVKVFTPVTRYSAGAATNANPPIITPFIT